jgi:hypothetical protein
LSLGRSSDADTAHETVSHPQEDWARGAGTYEHRERRVGPAKAIRGWHLSPVFAKHLPANLDEIAFRFNNWDNPYPFRDTLLRLPEGETPLKRLTGDRS